MKTITLIAKDQYNRVQAASKWQVTSRFNECLDKREKIYVLLGGFGYNFGSLTKTRELPVGLPDGIVNYTWPMHWTEEE